MKEGGNRMNETMESLAKVKKREPVEEIKNAHGVYILPNGKSHESGWGCMDFVAQTDDGLIGLGGKCDNVILTGEGFKVDCTTSGVVHIWNPYEFDISRDAITICFVSAEPMKN